MLSGKTAMFCIKVLPGGTLSLHEDDEQVGEAMLMVKAPHRMMLAGVPDSITSIQTDAILLANSGLFNKAFNL